MLKRWIAAVLILSMLLPCVPWASAAEVLTRDTAPVNVDGEVHNAQAQRKQIALMSDVYTQSVGNEYVEMYVGGNADMNSGRFTVGNVEGNPQYDSDDYQILLFGHGDPWSSYTTVRIDSRNYIFQADTTVYDAGNLKTTSTMTVENVLITQTLQIVKNSGTNLKDTVEIRYDVKNNSGTAKNIGIRIMMDTMLGNNDGAPFKVPSKGNVVKELELVGNQIPAYWQAFDNLSNPTVFSVGTLYRSGDRKPDKVLFTAWGNVYNDYNCWDYQIDPNAYVTGDSAVSVYWNPKQVDKGATTTVKTYYGVGYADTGVANTQTQIPANGFSVMVIDESGAPVSGAKVRCTNMTASPERTTNQDGIALFSSLPSGSGDTREVELTASKDGFQTLSRVMRIVKRGGSTGMTLYPNDGKAHIYGAIATFGGVSIDLLSHNKHFRSNPDGVKEAEDKSNVKQLTIKVEAASAKPIAKYQLIQAGQVKVESNTNTITLNVLTGTPQKPLSFRNEERISKLDAGQTVYLRVVDEDGNASERKALGLRISEPTTYGFTDTKGSLKLGEKLKISVPSNVPVLGDTEIELGWNGLPFEFEVFENGKVKFAINGDLAEGDYYTVDGASKYNWEEVKKDYNDAMESVASGRSSIAKSFGGKPQKFGAGKIDFKVDVMGYGEGYMDEYGNIHVNVGVVVTATQSGSYTWTYFLGYVPVYISVGETLSLSGKGQVSILASGGDISISGAVGEINPKITLNIDGGVGVNGVLSIGASGRGTLSWLRRWTDGYDKADLTCGVYITATAFLFKAEKKWKESTWTIYDRYTRTLSGAAGDGVSFYDTDAYTLIDRSYLDVPAVMSLDSSTVRYSVFPNASPKLVRVGDSAYLFWLEDIPSRAANDRTALVYSVSTDMTYWSDPVAIFPEDSTADYAFDLAVSGSTIHIALNKANRVFGETEIDLNDMAKAAEIVYVALDTATGLCGESVSLTDNQAMEAMPRIRVQEGNVLVSYFCNGMEGGLFDTGNSHGIGIAVPGQAPKLVQVDGDVREVEILSADAVVYTVDTDGDSDTYEDVVLYVTDGTTATQVAGAAGAVGLQSVQLGEQNAVLWHGGDNIYTLSAVDAQPQPQFAQDMCPVARNFSVIPGENGKLKLVWEEMNRTNEDNTNVAWAVTFDGAAWSGCYRLFDSQNELTAAMEGFSLGDTDYIAYLRTQGAQEDTSLTSLCVNTVTPDPELELAGVDFDPAAVAPGAQLPLTVTLRNNGAKTVDRVELYADGSYLADLEGLQLGQGETKTYTLEGGMTLPEDLSYVRGWEFYAECPEDPQPENNYATVNIGYVDLAVEGSQLLLNGQDWLNILVTNSNGIPADATLRVIADELDGAVLYESRLKEIIRDYSHSVMLNINDLDPAGSIEVFHIVLETDSEDVISLNNSITMNRQLSMEKTYTLQATATEGGSVTGSGSYTQGETVQLEAVPNRGYRFLRWESEDATLADENTAATTLVMPGKDVTVAAVFEYMPHDHEFGDYTEQWAPNCLRNGYSFALCLYCDVSVMREDFGTKLAHNIEDGVCTLCGNPAAAVEPYVERIYGENRFETAFKVAEEMKLNLGIEKFNTVIVASGADFADALSGSYLAATRSAPILLSYKAKQNAQVVEYIRNNLADGGTVYILGGKNAVPETMEEELEGFNVRRLAGANRFETNLEILKETGVQENTAVLVCTGTDFADCLSASAVGMPIMLVYKRMMDSQLEYLSELEGRYFVIIGGENAVKPEIEEVLWTYGGVERLAGANRFETSALVGRVFFGDCNDAVLAYARNYPDGLCGGSLAWTKGAPLILTDSKYYGYAEEFLHDKVINRGIVLGGDGLINDQTVRRLMNMQEGQTLYVK